jgi:tripartite-type tricarboxylate transporter receptor subunit TctC
MVPLNEVGVPGFNAAGWFMVAGSAGTPNAIVERLHKEFKEVMGLADVQEAVNRTGVVPVVSPPLADLSKFIVAEKERWGKVVTQSGLAGTL